MSTEASLKGFQVNLSSPIKWLVWLLSHMLQYSLKFRFTWQEDLWGLAKLEVSNKLVAWLCWGRKDGKENQREMSKEPRTNVKPITGALQRNVSIYTFSVVTTLNYSLWLVIMAICSSQPTYRSAYTPHPMSKEELSSSVSVQLFNGETQQLTITLENIGSEAIETLELTSKTVSTKGKSTPSKMRFCSSWFRFTAVQNNVRLLNKSWIENVWRIEPDMLKQSAPCMVCVSCACCSRDSLWCILPPTYFVLQPLAVPMSAALQRSLPCCIWLCIFHVPVAFQSVFHLFVQHLLRPSDLCSPLTLFLCLLLAFFVLVSLFMWGKKGGKIQKTQQNNKMTQSCLAFSAVCTVLE